MSFDSFSYNFVLICFLIESKFRTRLLRVHLVSTTARLYRYALSEVQTNNVDLPASGFAEVIVVFGNKSSPTSILCFKTVRMGHGLSSNFGWQLEQPIFIIGACNHVCLKINYVVIVLLIGRTCSVFPVILNVRKQRYFLKSVNLEDDCID